MNYCRTVTVFLFLLLCSFLIISGKQSANAQSSYQSQMLNPKVLPTALPPTPPPPIAVGSSAKVPNPQHAETIKANQGWQIITFPLGRVEAVSGLPRMLVRKGPSGIEYIDAVNNPEKIDPGLAYITYFDKPGIVSYSGQANNGSIYHSTTLFAGWNLLGCPTTALIDRQNITVTRAGGITARPLDVCNGQTTPSSAWLYSKVYYFSEGKWQSRDLLGHGKFNSTVQVTAIFCWSEMTLNWNSTPPQGGIPKIGFITPEVAAPGDEVVIKGRYLGEAGHGVVLLDGIPVSPGNVDIWTPSVVKFRVPPGATSSNISVMVDRYPANTLKLSVSAPPVNTNYPRLPNVDNGTGSLIGEVVSSSGSPLVNATIQLQSGPSTVTNARGQFELANIPPQQTTAFITLPGYKSARGQVTIVAGQKRTLKVSLSSTGASDVGARSQESLGTFHVVGQAERVGPRERRFWVYQIEVWEYGNASKSWKNTWWEDHGDLSYDLRCDDAHLGRDYCVKITWRNRRGRERSSTFNPKFTSNGQTFTYDSPVDY